MRLGFVGLGNIGGPCARRLLEAGHEVTVVDTDDDARARLVDAGARVAEGLLVVDLSTNSLATTRALHAACAAGPASTSTTS